MGKKIREPKDAIDGVIWEYAQTYVQGYGIQCDICDLAIIVEDRIDGFPKFIEHLMTHDETAEEIGTLLRLKDRIKERKETQ